MNSRWRKNIQGAPAVKRRPPALQATLNVPALRELHDAARHLGRRKIFAVPLESACRFSNSFSAARAVYRTPSWVRCGRRASGFRTCRLAFLRNHLALWRTWYEDHLRLRAPVALHHRLRSPGRSRRRRAAPHELGQLPTLQHRAFLRKSLPDLAGGRRLWRRRHQRHSRAERAHHRGQEAREDPRRISVPGHCGASVPARVQPGRACPGQAGLFQGWALDHRLGPRGPGGHEAAPDRNRERRIFPLADRAETGSLTARSRLMITGRGAPTHKTRSSSHA